MYAVMALIHTEFKETEYLEVKEKRIVSQFGKLPTLDPLVDQHLPPSIQRQIDDLRSALKPLGIQLIHMKHTDSIAVFFLLKSLADVQHFTNAYESGQLQLVLEKVFSSLSDKGHRLIINRLMYDGTGLSKQKKHFQMLQGIQINFMQHLTVNRDKVPL